MDETKKKISPEKSPSKSSLKKLSSSRSSGRKSAAGGSLTENHRNEPDNLLSFKTFKLEAERFKDNPKSLLKLEKFYENLFNSFQSLNKCLKRKHQKRQQKEVSSSTLSASEKCIPTEQQLSDPCTDRKFLIHIYQTLPNLPDHVKKTVLLGMTDCLLKQNNREKTEDDIRAYYILLQNPFFIQCDSYVVFAHLLKQVAALPSQQKIQLCQWLRRLSTPRFRPIVINLQLFISRSMKKLKQLVNSLTDWWLPSALVVLNLLNDANNCLKPRLISFREFYNDSINQVDLLKEFDIWKLSSSPFDFNFCQFPCALSLVSKQRIIKHEQESEMVHNAKDELETQIRRRPTRLPATGKLFLNIQVRRHNLLQDSLDQIFLHKNDLKKKLRVEFVGEPGFDMGGITKEWFLLLLRQILHQDYNTLVYNETTRCYWFAHNSSDNSSDLFLVGVLLGLAVYNNITLHLRMPLVCYRKLLSIPAPRTSPNKQSQSYLGNHSTSTHTSHGHVSCTLEDFRQVDPDMAHGLEELLQYEGDVEQDFDLRFEVDHQDIGRVTTVPLLPNGNNIPLTNSNRHHYVQMIIDYKLNQSIHKQFVAFSRGFHTACSSVALSFLCPEELEVLICGVAGFSIVDLRKYTTYKGYTNDDETIKYLWQVLAQLSSSKQRRFLHFCTGGDRIPVSGWQELHFTVIKAPTPPNMLPMAHTCFNQLLLPPYTSKQLLAEKLTIAIDNAEGFGLE